MASIVVVGGGVAGLACAWQLRAAGHDVEILERAAVPGGDLRTHALDGYRLERGATALGPGDARLRSLVRALALPVRPIVPGGRALLGPRGFEPLSAGGLRPLLRSSLIGGRARLRVARLAAGMLARRAARAADPLAEAAREEHEDAATALARRVGVQARDRLIGPLVESECGGAPLDSLSDALAALVLEGRLLPPHFDAVQGGMGRITTALADRLAVRCGCEAVAVEAQRDGARVRYRASGRLRSVYADAAVVAVAPSRAAGLCPGLLPEERALLASFASLRAIDAHLLLDELPPRLPGYAVEVPSARGLDIVHLRVEHAKPDAAPPGAGLLRASLSAGAVARGWSSLDDRLAARVLDAIERTPLGRLRPRRVHIERREHALCRFAPGSLRARAAFLARSARTPRLVFANEAQGGPGVEGAVRSALEAARAADRALHAAGPQPAAAPPPP